MKEPDLSRYEKTDLERMLYGYRSIARTHLDQGHWALAKWATRMVTLIHLELSLREAVEREDAESQLQLGDEPPFDADN